MKINYRAMVTSFVLTVSGGLLAVTGGVAYGNHVEAEAAADLHDSMVKIYGDPAATTDTVGNFNPDAVLNLDQIVDGNLVP